ncbi:MAG: hypothetical protein U0R19_30730 [Bryobacteraceae bacterium]
MALGWWILFLACCVASSQAAMGCTAITGNEPKEKLLAYLQRDRQLLEPGCVWKIVLADVGKGDLDFGRAFVALLDYPGIENPQRRVIVSPQREYPALGGLMLVGKSAQPLVLAALTDAESTDDARKYAALVVFLLNRNSVLEGARELGAAYWGVTDQAIAKKVLDAVILATRACGPEQQPICQAEIFKRPGR